MRSGFGIVLLWLAFCLSASADIWRWVDEQGVTHYVNSQTPIWTWVDADGVAHYSDKPEHASAVPVALVWYSGGELPTQDQTGPQSAVKRDSTVVPGESNLEREQRIAAEAYYCSQAQRIYETYKNAPQLFRTNADGEREYLTSQESAAKLEETRLRVAELCG